MDMVLRGCSTSCDLYQVSPPRYPLFKGNFMLGHVKDNSMLLFRGVICKVSSYCLDSDLDAKQKLSLQYWNYKDNLSIAQPIKGEEELCTKSEIVPLNPNPNPNTNPNSDSKHKQTKLHFLQERDENTLSQLYFFEERDEKTLSNDTQLHFLVERDEKTLSSRLITLSRSNKTRSAIELFLSMDASSLRPDSHACNSLLSCLLRNGLLPGALKVFDKMINSEMATPHSYTLVLKTLARIEGCNKALALFHKLEQVKSSKRKFDIIVYNTMISICARSKNWVEAEKLWRKLSENSLKGTLLTYDLLISTFVQCGCAELVFEAYQELVRIRLIPNENIYKAIIATCTLEGDWELSLSLLNKMINSKIKPSLVTFNSIINCLGKSGNAELAFGVYKTLQLNNLQPDVYTINALLSALYKSNRFSDVIKLFQRVKKEEKINLNSHVYNVVLMVFRKLGFWDRALQLLFEMERTGIEMHIDSYNHVIFACEIGCEPSVALRVYRHIVQRGCKTDNFTILPLIRCCISGSFWSDLDEILKDIAPDMSLYNTIIHELCLQDKVKLARKIHVKMLKIGLMPDKKTNALILKHFRK